MKNLGKPWPHWQPPATEGYNRDEKRNRTEQGGRDGERSYTGGHGHGERNTGQLRSTQPNPPSINQQAVQKPMEAPIESDKMEVGKIQDPRQLFMAKAQPWVVLPDYVSQDWNPRYAWSQHKERPKNVRLSSQIVFEKRYTTLAVDGYNRWLCPWTKFRSDDKGLQHMFQSKNLDLDDFQNQGFVVVKTADEKQLVKMQNDKMYHDVYNQMDSVQVMYFGNPPDARECLWEWRNLNGTITRCSFDRVDNADPRPYEYKEFDPDDDDSLIEIGKLLTQGIKRKSALWACWGCSFSLKSLLEDKDRWKEFHDYAMSETKYQQRCHNGYTGRHMIVKILRLDGQQEWRVCYINSFVQSASRPSRISWRCNNNRFGLGPGGGKYVKCRYRYGRLADFYDEGFKLCKWPKNGGSADTASSRRREGSGRAAAIPQNPIHPLLEHVPQAWGAQTGFVPSLGVLPSSSGGRSGAPLLAPGISFNPDPIPDAPTFGNDGPVSGYNNPETTFGNYNYDRWPGT